MKGNVRVLSMAGDFIPLVRDKVVRDIPLVRVEEWIAEEAERGRLQE